MRLSTAAPAWQHGTSISGLDSLPFACAMPTPTFTLPSHGKLVVSGQASIGGLTVPFQGTVPF